MSLSLNRHHCFITIIVWFLTLLTSIGMIALIVPTFAQEKPTAPIIVEGRTIFNVSESGQYTAQQRANDANTQIQRILNENEPPINIEIDETKEVPILRLNNNYLLSVTSNDTPKGRELKDQAQEWKKKLEIAIRKAEYERTSRYFIQAILISVGVIFVALILSWKLNDLWQHWLKPLVKKEEVSSSSPTQTTTATQPLTSPTVETSSNLHVGFFITIIITRGIIWIIALGYISRLFPQTREWSNVLIDILKVSLITDIFPLGNDRYSVLDFFILAGLLIGLVVVTRTVSRVLKSKLLSATGLNRAVQDTTALIVNYSLIFLGTIVVLQVWGLDLSSLTVFASVLGVGIGLGLQGIAKEFVSGLVLIFERPIQVGDFVEVGGLMGTVEKISVRSTEIRTLDQISVILPNSRFLESEVINWSHYSPISRLKIPVGVAYGSDLEKVKQILITTAKNHREVLSMPSPQVFFTEFGESSLNFDLLVWISKPYKQFQIKSDLYFQIDTNFRKQGVEVPFPQRDLHFRSTDVPQGMSPELLESLANLSNSLAIWLNTNAHYSHRQDNDKSNQEKE